MKVRLLRRTGYWELVPADAGEDARALAETLDRGEAKPAFAVWDLSGAGPLRAEPFAELVGSSALLRLRGVRVFVAGQAPMVARFLMQLGMKSAGGREAIPGAGLAVLRRLLARHVPPGASSRSQSELDELLDRCDLDDEVDAVRELYRWRAEPPPSPPAPDPLDESVAARPRPPVNTLGEILIELGVISSAQLDEALVLQRHERARGKLGNLLIRMGLVTDEQIFGALEEQYRRSRQRLPASGVDWQGHARDTRESLLGNVLLSLGILSSEGLERALREQWSAGGRENLGTVLLRLGLVTRPQLFRALEKQAELKARARRGAGALAARLPRS